jgi:alkylation response protein AidB-like acyl-CoA dehydrogenase
MAATAGGYRGRELARAAAHPAYVEWEGKLSAARLICPQWPEEFGGQGMDAVRLAVLNEEFHRAGLPRVRRGMGEALVGPSVIVHGTPEQRGYFLPRIISGEDTYCQGFSEPDYGSDLAGVQTRAEVDGDEIVVTGQKVWTSGAAKANMMFALCRSDPDAEKHKGLAYVLIPFTGAGVQYRPIRQMSGASEFCEDFLDGVRAPLFNVIGGLNNGWRVAMTTLGHERGGQATVQHLGFEREFWELVDTARKYGRNTDPLVRQQLARAYTGVQLMRFSGLRTLAQVAEGRPPGPEASVTKLLWSEYHKRLGEIAITIIGTDALVRPDGPDYPTTAWQNVFLSSRAGTIYSGTSEIQRNIIGERALGLPKEPRAAS